MTVTIFHESVENGIGQKRYLFRWSMVLWLHAKSLKAIFYWAVRTLKVKNFLASRHKIVSKVLDKWWESLEKYVKNDCETSFITSDSQKMTSRCLLSSFFCTKFQISRPGWCPDRSIKILQMENWFLSDGKEFSHRCIFVHAKYTKRASKIFCLFRKYCHSGPWEIYYMQKWCRMWVMIVQHAQITSSAFGFYILEENSSYGHKWDWHEITLLGEIAFYNNSADQQKTVCPLQ